MCSTCKRYNTCSRAAAGERCRNYREAVAMRVKPKARLRKKKLIWAPYSGTCGLGTVCEVRLVVDGETVHTYYTCPCGRGCGNKDEVPQDLPMEWE